jgi:ferredoxin
MAINSTEELNRKARQLALAAVSALPVKTTSLVKYESAGVVAIIGDERAQQAAAELQGALTPHLILDTGKAAGGIAYTSRRDRTVTVEGYLGNFTINLHGADEDEALRLSDSESLQADLVLDLSASPLLSMALTPPGYVYCSTDDDELRSAVAELSALTGTFEKPKYFDYNPAICAHGRSGITACTRCIDACPAGAIKGLVETIKVEPHLCQGGGACATVCPSGAIRYVYPTTDDLLAQLRCLLNVYLEEGGQQPVLAFYAREQALPESCAANILPVAVEELASVGMETWLSALAYGASSVLLVDDGRIPDHVSSEIDQQLLTVCEILTAMHYPADAVRRVDTQRLHKLGDTLHLMPPIKTSTFAGVGGKRQTAFMAIDALYQQALTGSDGQPAAMVTLSTGAPFGAAAINEKSCTLCLSCVSACPGNALQSGQHVPQVRFIESNCLQCGLCTHTCPEDAIWITPRLVFDHQRRNQPVTLYEEEPFCCIACGKPFASQSVINKMTAKLAGHSMFTDENAMRRLKMCEDCRVVDIVQDEEMMGIGIDSERITH